MGPNVAPDALAAGGSADLLASRDSLPVPRWGLGIGPGALPTPSGTRPNTARQGPKVGLADRFTTPFILDFWG